MPLPDAIYRFGPFELRARTRELYKNGVRLKVRPQPFQILLALLARSGDIVSREELRRLLWSAETFVDFEHGLNTAIKELRGLLSDSASEPRYIETLPKLGYQIKVRVYEAKPEISTLPSSRSGTFDLGEIHAVAVLPLEDLSGEQGRDYFADGMTEALITSLARIKALRVISRTSAMQYKGARKSLPQIARELNVDAVVEGSVVRSGERVRISAQLIHAKTDQHLWAESYERDLRDVLSLQNELARTIASEVQVKLTPDERRQLATARRVDPEAHELYLKGRYFWNKRREPEVRKALQLFQQAIDRDPTYAAGYSGVADSYNILAFYGNPPAECFPKSRAAANKALEFDPALSEGHGALGVVKRDFEWDWPGAYQEFKLTNELNPNYPGGYHWRCGLSSALGKHEEAVRDIRKAQELDPLSLAIQLQFGRTLYYARDYEGAVREFRAGLDLESGLALAHSWMGLALQRQDLHEDAMAAFRQGVELSNGHPNTLALLANGSACAGKINEARTILRALLDLSPKKYVSAYDIALTLVALDEKEQALSWLEKAIAERSMWLSFINVEPQLDPFRDPLRSDPRFQDLLRRMGLAK